MQYFCYNQKSIIIQDSLGISHFRCVKLIKLLYCFSVAAHTVTAQMNILYAFI